MSIIWLFNISKNAPDNRTLDIRTLDNRVWPIFEMIIFVIKNKSLFYDCISFFKCFKFKILLIQFNETFHYCLEQCNAWKLHLYVTLNSRYKLVWSTKPTDSESHHHISQPPSAPQNPESRGSWPRCGLISIHLTLKRHTRWPTITAISSGTVVNFPRTKKARLHSTNSKNWPESRRWSSASVESKGKKHLSLKVQKVRLGGMNASDVPPKRSRTFRPWIWTFWWKVSSRRIDKFWWLQIWQLWSRLWVLLGEISVKCFGTFLNKSYW